MPYSVAGSQRSRGSKKSQVDDTLFGNGKKGQNGAVPASASVISTKELRELRAQTEKGQKADAAIITASELERIKASTKIQTKEEKMQETRIFQEQKE